MKLFFKKKLNSLIRIRNKVTEVYAVLKNYQLLNSYRVQSHLTNLERIKLYELTKNKRCVIEIGSYLGASACCFAEAVSKANGAVFCIDTWENDAMTEGKKETFRDFLKNTESYSGVINPIQGFSFEVIDKLTALTNVADVLFIDGDHSYEGVKKDWELYKKFLKKNSIVIFHDYGWAEGVQRVIAEDVIGYASSSGSLPNLWWGVIK